MRDPVAQRAPARRSPWWPPCAGAAASRSRQRRPARRSSASRPSVVAQVARVAADGVDGHPRAAVGDDAEAGRARVARARARGRPGGLRTRRAARDAAQRVARGGEREEREAVVGDGVHVGVEPGGGRAAARRRGRRRSRGRAWRGAAPGGGARRGRRRGSAAPARGRRGRRRRAPRPRSRGPRPGPGRGRGSSRSRAGETSSASASSVARRARRAAARGVRPELAHREVEHERGQRVVGGRVRRRVGEDGAAAARAGLGGAEAEVGDLGRRGG